MADHLTTTLTLATTEQDHLDIHLAQAVRFNELASLTPAIISALVALVNAPASPVATEAFVGTAVTTHAALTSDVHGADSLSDESLLIARGGGSRIFADRNEAAVPVGVTGNDIRIAPPA